MTLFGKRVWEINKHLMSKEFEELRKKTKLSLRRKAEASGDVYKAPVAKKGKFKKLK